MRERCPYPKSQQREIPAKVVATVLGMVADMEQKFLRDRRRAGTAAAPRALKTLSFTGEKMPKASHSKFKKLNNAFKKHDKKSAPRTKAGLQKRRSVNSVTAFRQVTHEGILHDHARERAPTAS